MSSVTHPPLGAVPEPQALGFEDLARRDDRLAAGFGEAREQRPLEVRDVDAIDDMKEISPHASLPASRRERDRLSAAGAQGCLPAMAYHTPVPAKFRDNSEGCQRATGTSFANASTSKVICTLSRGRLSSPRTSTAMSWC